MKKMVYLACLAGLVFATGCSETKKEDAVPAGTEAQKEVVMMKKIGAEELKEKMSKTKDVMVINALDEKAYNECHIKGSINIPLSQLADKAKDWKKDAEIVLYCGSIECPVSKNASEVLKGLGFTNVSVYEGGMKEWKEKKFDTDGKCPVEPTKAAVKEEPMK
jgi:rhodanese-related sulfurtransferase